MILAMAVMLTALPSCEKEDLKEPDGEQTEQPEDEPSDEDKQDEDSTAVTPVVPVVTYSVAATLGDSVKDIFDWADTDLITAWATDAAGKSGYDISQRDVAPSKVEGNAAQILFNALPAGGKAWLAHMTNSGYDGCSAQKVEFNYKASYTQATAGVPAREMVKLISPELALPAVTPAADTTVELSTEMRLVGTLVKAVPVSVNYASEKVKSIMLLSLSEYIAGLENSAMAYNMTDGGKYWQNLEGTAFGTECRLFWDATSPSITTEVMMPEAVSEGKAVFLCVPPLKIGGYKYVVTTDVAIYTFDFSSEDLVMAENTVLPVTLDLDATEGVKRIALADIKGELRYEGGLAQEYSFSCNAGQGGLSYWYAQTCDTGADVWVTREGRDLPEYYKDVRFVITDDATGAPADWLEVYYRAGDTWWDYKLLSNEQPAPRSATVTALYDDVNGYLIGDAYRAKTVKVIQKARLTVEASLESKYSDKIPAAGLTDVVAAKLSLSIGGVPVSDVAAALAEHEVSVVPFGGARLVKVAPDGTITLNFMENRPNKERNCGVEVVYNDEVKAAVSFLQAAGTSEEGAFTYEFGAWQKGHNGQYTIQFEAAQTDFKHWLAVFGNLKMYGETPAAMSEADTKQLVMQMLGITSEAYDSYPFNFILEYGGAGESKILISIKEVNESGQMKVYEGDIYEADQSAIINHFIVNHLAQ